MTEPAGPTKVRTEGNVPVQKVRLSALAGMLVTIVIYFLNRSTFHANPIPGEVSALTTTLVSGLVGYIVPPGKDERIVAA